jgi:2-methylcitrate dehydratase PrpD
MSGRLGLAVGSQHYTLGFHNTATLGTIAAAAACARLVNATERQTAVILGIATTQSAGLRAQFGSDVKPLHAGLAAQTAVIATQLTLAGFHGQPDNVLDSFYRLIAPVSSSRKSSSQAGARRGGLSRPVWNSNPIRPAAGTHSAADAARALRHEWLQTGNGMDALIAAIERIDVSFRRAAILRRRCENLAPALKPGSVWST